MLVLFSMSQIHQVQNDKIMFITTNTLNMFPVFKNPGNAREAIECLYRVQEIYPFLLYAFVIMPDHCHFLLNVPSPNTISRVMNSYKSGLTFDMNVKKLWQRGFHIRCPNDPLEVKRYIHLNPVKAGIVKSDVDYRWSSASGIWDVSPIFL